MQISFSNVRVDVTKKKNEKKERKKHKQNKEEHNRKKIDKRTFNPLWVARRMRRVQRSADQNDFAITFVNILKMKL